MSTAFLIRILAARSRVQCPAALAQAALSKYLGQLGLAGVAAVMMNSAAVAAESADYVQAGAALARSKNCLACHQVDSRRVGPPLASVAKRYGPPADFTDYLVQTIRQGGKGKWGAVPMPAQPQVNEEEGRQLAAWILSLAPPETPSPGPAK